MKKFILTLLLVTLMAMAVSAIMPQPRLGDIDRDGRVTIVDALLVAQIYVDPEPDGFIGTYADVDCNDKVDIIDALYIAQYYVGEIDAFPCVKPGSQYLIRVSAIVDHMSGPDSEDNIKISYTGDYNGITDKTPCVIGPYSEPFTVRLEAMPWYGSPLRLYAGVTITSVDSYYSSANSLLVSTRPENPEVEVQFRYVIEREIFTPLPQSTTEPE